MLENLMNVSTLKSDGTPNIHPNPNVNFQGAPKSLDVLKHSGKYIKKDIVILQLRENGLNYRWLEAK